MRTTLEIDDQVLQAARELAAARKMSIGAAVSLLAKRGLSVSAVSPAAVGFPVVEPVDPGHVITDELVAEHRDDQ